MERRGQARQKVQGICHWWHDGKLSISPVADLSSQGARIGAAVPPPVGAEVTVTLRLEGSAGHDHGPSASCSAHVVRLVHDGFAIAFDRPQPGFIALLDEA